MEEQKGLIISAAAMPDVRLDLADIKKYIAPSATDKELFMFLNICKSYGLNPFKREVHFIKYGTNPGQTIVGYEMYLKRAEKTGLLDGWEISIGKDDMGQKATITIYRKDRSKPVVWTVYRSEFDSQQANWKKMPLFMLRKVAIAQGFRLAFPEDLGGMPYLPEEINGATSEDLAKDVVPEVLLPDDPSHQAKPVGDNQQGQPDKPMSEPQRKMLWSKMKTAGLDTESMKEFFAYVKPITSKEASAFIENFDGKLEEWRMNRELPEPGSNG